MVVDKEFDLSQSISDLNITKASGDDGFNDSFDKNDYPSSGKGDEDCYTVTGGTDNENSTDEIVEEQEIPECSYCSISGSFINAQCGTCKKWFCNTKFGSNKTHIIEHLKRSDHKTCRVYDENEICFLECFHCNARDIFKLGYIENNNELLICDKVCKKLTKEHLALWKPIVKNSKISSIIIDEPTQEQRKSAHTVCDDDINNIENLWKRGNKITMFEAQYPRILERYESTLQYRAVNKVWIKEELHISKIMCDELKQIVTDVRWIGEGIVREAFFCLPNQEDNTLHIAIGVRIKLTYSDASGCNWKFPGQITKVPDNVSEEIGYILSPPVTNDVMVKKLQGKKLDFIFEVVWDYTSFARQFTAMDRLTDISQRDKSVIKKLMGMSVNLPKMKKLPITDYAISGLAELNKSQIDAIKECLFNPLTLIQGPPGTGKTVTIAALTYHFSRKENGQILVCAPSNIAADNLTEAIDKTGLKVVRVCSYFRQFIKTPVTHLSLHTLAEELRKELSSKHKKAPFIDACEDKILNDADVICATCNGAGSKIFETRSFKNVIIDESTQAVEPDILIPILKGANKVVLVGDPKQLGPVVMSKLSCEAGFQRSLFERMIELGQKPKLLDVQYRMHPGISSFPNKQFYDGEIKDGVKNEDRVADQPNILPIMPTIFWECFGSEQHCSSGRSFLNKEEAEKVVSLAHKLIKEGVPASSIGIISPYRGQKSYILHCMRVKGLNPHIFDDLEVASIDAFQGREKDYIIFTCVRASKYKGIGFLKDPRRLNVALTRARKGLIIIGNPHTLSKDSLWYSLLKDYQSRGLIYDGNLSNMFQSKRKLKKPVA